MSKFVPLGPRMSIRDLADHYCVVCILEKSSARQLRWVVSQFCQWANPVLGRPPILPDLLKGIVDQWSDELSSTFSPGTVRSRTKSLLALWRFAASQGAVVPPCSEDGLKARNPRPEALPLPDGPRKPLSVDSTLEDVLLDYRLDRTVTAKTFQQMQITTRQYAGWYASRYGKTPTIGEAFDRREVHEWLDWLASKRSAATVNSKRTNVVTLWNYAADPPHELTKPPRKIKRFTVGVDPPNAWTLDQFDKIMTAARETPGEWLGVPAGQCWEMGLLILWDTACRFGELWQAEVCDVDFEQGTLRVKAVNRKGRRRGKVYPLHPQTLTAIRVTLDGPPRSRLWPFPFRKEVAWVHYAKILERAGLPATRKHKFHAVRRTAESHAAQKLGAEVAAEAVGHGLAIAKKHYLSPDVYKPASLIDGLPRPKGAVGEPSLWQRLASVFKRAEAKT